MGKEQHEPHQEPEYTQMSFAAWEEEPQEEITLDHCVVTVIPTYTKQGKGYLWECVVYEPPDLFHQEQNDTYHVHALTSAKEMHKKRLRPGDVVRITGTPYAQDVTLHSGETHTINHLTVSAMTVLTRAQRKTITVFEVDKQKNNTTP